MRLLLIAAAAIPMICVAADQASAQQINAANGFPVGGGFNRGGGGGWNGRPAFNRGVGWNRPGRQWQGGAWRNSGWRGGAYRPYPRYRYGGSPYWDVGAGLATAATIGALATYPAYQVYPDYEPAYPVYPAYQVYQPGPVASGDQCSTPVKMCTLYEPAQLGVGCSCRVPGGQARGTVVP